MELLTPHLTLLLASGIWVTPLVPPLWLLESIPLDVGLSSTLLLSAGLVGSALLDRLFNEGDGDSDPLTNGDTLDGDGLEDGFGDFDDGDGMDDWDNPFGDKEERGDSMDELDHRLSELESEVAQLSSTVNTVRGENTEISNSVDDIGENVRKLLDVYEMVTRGVNPFVDDAHADGFESTSFGLFDDPDDPDDPDDSDDDSITSADVDEFFAEDHLDDGVDHDGTLDDGLLGDDFDGGVTEETETQLADDSRGKSFSELKEEYEAVDSADSTSESDDQNSTEAHSESDATGRFQFGVTNGTDGGTGADESPKPYLTSLPDAYVGDLLVIEWMEFLVENSDVTDAARAVRYYERIDWVAPAVARTLEEYLVGFGSVNVAETDGPAAPGLSLSHHVHSLEYVQALSGSVADGRPLGPKPFDPGDDGI